MTLITEAYRQQQAQLHAENDSYGSASVAFAPVVAKVMNQYQVAELLDYGAGKLRLSSTISEKRLVDHRFKYIPFEPSNPRFSETPEPAEMVACIDVLEHIEPDCLEAVLDDLLRVTKRIGLFTVSTVPAMKTLPDGRNAHLIVRPPQWWLSKILERWELHVFQKTEDGFLVLVMPFNVEEVN